MYLVFPVGRDPVPGRHMIGRALRPIGSIFFPPLPLPHPRHRSRGTPVIF